MAEILPRRRVTFVQLEQLWEFLNRNRHLATGFNKTAQAREFSKRMWKEVAQHLNSHGDGAIKDWKGWCKYWNDYKSKLKKMTAELRISQQRTGGGASQLRELTELEKKFLDLLGQDFGQGVPEARVEPFEEILMPEPVPGPSWRMTPPPNFAPDPEGAAQTTGAAQAEESPLAGAVQTPPRTARRERTSTRRPPPVSSPRRRRVRAEPPMIQQATRRLLVQISNRRAEMDERRNTLVEQLVQELREIKEILRSRCKTWLKAIGRMDLESKDVNTLHTSYFVCDCHFAESDRLKKKLKRKAVPTLILPQLDNLSGISKYTQTDDVKLTKKQMAKLACEDTRKRKLPFELELESKQRRLLETLIKKENCDMVTLFQEEFGTLKGESVMKFTWKLDSGFALSVISYGAIVQSILMPDKDGEINDIALGFDDLNGYVNRNTPYFGATIGRCANRIGGGEIDIDGVQYNISKNIGNNTLHGGIKGFDKVNWNYIVDGNKVTFSYFSKDSEEGFPGNLVVSVTYEVTDKGSLIIRYSGSTDKKTVINLTNHSYFNLGGHDSGAEEMYKHSVAINADKITETDSESIPTGRSIDVGGTPYDLRIARRIGDVINQAETLYDDNFCVTSSGDKRSNFVARVTHPNGRYFEVYSTQPGVQFYTSNALPAPSESALIGKGGVGYRRHGALCLEAQNYPDAIHHSNFPKAVLSPGEVYDEEIVYSFGVDKGNSPNVVSA